MITAPRKNLAAVTTALALACTAAAAAAHGEAGSHAHDHASARAHGAHVHGLARLDLAHEGDLLEIALESPGMNLVGFEGKPRNAADTAKVAAARALLADASQAFAIEPADACTPAGAGAVDVPAEALSAPGGNAAASADHAQGHEHHDDHAHDHKHEHDHAHDHAQGSHSDWSASWRWRCTAPPLAIEVKLFKAFAGFERIEAQVATAAFQTGVELTPSSPRISLAKRP